MAQMCSVVSLFVGEVQRVMEEIVVSMHQENFGRWGEGEGKTLMREGREGEEEGENKITILAMQHNNNNHHKICDISIFAMGFLSLLCDIRIWFSILAMRHKDFYLCYATWHGETSQHDTLYFGE